MEYRSIADMNDAIIRNLHRLPRDIDLVVGIPRSGLLAANLFGLITNIPVTDLDRFIEGKVYTSGISTKRRAALDRDVSEMRRVLVLDDSVNSGRALKDARHRLAEAGIAGDLILAAIYGSKASHPEADFVFERVPNPRIFQWNFMHHIVLEKSCVDIDGVLCLDPTDDENDDGENYARFLSDALPLHGPSRKIGYLVTSRLEKYRTATEEWLARHDIRYGELVMLDLPSKEERQRLRVHGSFKADFYRKSEARLFIESEQRQAETIARLSGKPVLCVETHEVFLPDPLSPVALQQRIRNLPGRLKQKNSGGRIKSLTRSVLGDPGYTMLKNLVRSRTGR